MANSDAPTTGWRNEKRALVIVLFSFVFLFLVGVSIRIVLATRQRMYGEGWTQIGYLSWNEVLTDNEDRLWVTNWRIGGPEYLQPVVADATLPNEISLPQRLLDCEIWKDDTCAPITAGSDGRFWGIGENGALLSGLYHDESWQETVLPGTRAEPQTGWVVADSSGKVWIALDGNPYTAEIVDGDIRVEVEEGNDVWAYAAGERTLWRIRANRLERRAAAGSWETITNAPETIQALTLRGDEPVLAWCGEDGVLRLAALSGEIARLEGLTPSRCVVTALAAEENGAIWAGTRNEGLLVFNERRWGRLFLELSSERPQAVRNILLGPDAQLVVHWGNDVYSMPREEASRTGLWYDPMLLVRSLWVVGTGGALLGFVASVRAVRRDELRRRVMRFTGGIVMWFVVLGIYYSLIFRLVDEVVGDPWGGLAVILCIYGAIVAPLQVAITVHQVRRHQWSGLFIPVAYLFNALLTVAFSGHFDLFPPLLGIPFFLFEFL